MIIESLNNKIVQEKNAIYIEDIIFLQTDKKDNKLITGLPSKIEYSENVNYTTKSLLN